MSDLNQTNQTVRLTRKPELKQTTSGKTVCTFSGAINEKYGQNENVYFFDYQAWGKPAEIITQYCDKGSQLAITSKAIQQRWEDTNGQKRSKIVFVVQSFTFIGGNKSNQNQGQEQPNNYGYTPDIPESPEDIF